jgi:transcriptional regulator GlxA family with amidase domain
MSADPKTVRVCLVAIPEVMASTLLGLYDVLNSFNLLGTYGDGLAGRAHFKAQIVASTAGALSSASGVPIEAKLSIKQIDAADVIIIPSIMVERGEWQQGRYPGLVKWLGEMHAAGAQLCSTCSGVLLLAETGLLDGRDATVHWMYASTFRRNFPNVRLRLDRALVAAGKRQEFLMSGASTSWHDLILYLIAQHAGPTAAQAVAKFFAFQWHADGISPYIVFEPVTDHGDAAIHKAQSWLSRHFSVANPVEQGARISGIPERTFKRRFKNATGHAPIDYVQRLRVEEAKRRLERTQAPVDEISWKVGYEDPAFFRRLFKRITGVTAGSYRRKFHIPEVEIP